MDLNSILGRNNKNNTTILLIIIVIVVLLLSLGNGYRNTPPPVAGLNFGSFNVGGSPFNDVGFVNRYGGPNSGSNNNIFFILLILALLFLLGRDSDNHEDNHEDDHED